MINRPIFKKESIYKEEYILIDTDESGEGLYKRCTYLDEDNFIECCPRCGKELFFKYKNYCSNCGLKISWE